MEVLRDSFTLDIQGKVIVLSKSAYCHTYLCLPLLYFSSDPILFKFYVERHQSLYTVDDISLCIVQKPGTN